LEKNIGFERRRQQKDRRKSTRSGKYDRRKNTCGNCIHFKPQNQTAGLCLKHQTMIRANDFACVFYTADSTSPTPPQE
jgi:hypothetical protein